MLNKLAHSLICAEKVSITANAPLESILRDCDPFYASLPSHSHKSANAYAIRSYQARECKEGHVTYWRCPQLDCNWVNELCDEYKLKNSIPENECLNCQHTVEDFGPHLGEFNPWYSEWVYVS